MEEPKFCFHFRKFYGKTQLQNFEQQNRRKLGQMKHPIIHVHKISPHPPKKNTGDDGVEGSPLTISKMLSHFCNPPK